MSELAEIWKPAFDWEAFYEVSDHGRIRSKPRSYGNRRRGGSILKHILNDRGYPCVNLTGEGKRKQRHVHLLVIRTFCGPAPDGFETCHNDGNPLNTHLSNLRYDTPKGNAADRRKHGTHPSGEKNPFSKLTAAHVIKLRTGELSKKQVMAELGVSLGCVDNAKYGATWKHV